MSLLRREFYGSCMHCDGEGQRKVMVDSNKILGLTLDHMDNKIEAVKSVRTAYSILSLKDAKDLVEHTMNYIISMDTSLQNIELQGKFI